MKDYKPISCELHSSLELWIMHRERLKLVWHIEGGKEVALSAVMPVDVATEEGAEYLYFVQGGNNTPTKVRLDYIMHVEPLLKKES